MNWDSFTFPILVGTPVSTAGVLANSADVVGIVPRTVKQKPDAGDELYLMTGGSVYLSEIAYTDLSVAAMQELDGIDFYKLNGHVQPKGGSGGGLTPEQEALIQNAQWKTEGTPTTLFTETVTVASLDDGENIIELTSDEDFTANDTIIVTYDGTEYTLSKHALGDDFSFAYGVWNDSTMEPDFSEVPFCIIAEPKDYEDGCINTVFNSEVGSHTVSVAVPTAGYTEAFVTGVEANIPAADFNKIGGVQKVRFTESASAGEDVDGSLINDLLGALDDAGIIQWDSFV